METEFLDEDAGRTFNVKRQCKDVSVGNENGDNRGSNWKM